MLLHNLPAYARELAELVQAIREDRPVSMPPSELCSPEIALAAVRSAHIGQPVLLDTPGAVS